MTLRTPEPVAQALRQRATLEGRSQQEIVIAAIEEYLDRHSHRDLLERVLDEQLPRYAEALRRLGE